MGLGERDAWLQERYARWLDALTKLAFAISVAGFAVYLAGGLPPLVPIAELPQLWGLPLAEYVSRTGAPSGWAWLQHLGRGDYLNYVGLSLFACVVLLCNLAVVVPLFRRGERLMGILVTAQIAVLAIAASGLVG